MKKAKVLVFAIYSITNSCSPGKEKTTTATTTILSRINRLY